MLEHIYSHGVSRIQLHAEGQPFHLERGVRQGDSISPKLFISWLQSIFCKLNWQEKKYGLCIGEEHLTNLRFADNIVLIAKSTELQQMMNDLTRESSRVGLNVNKTKVMSKTPASININNQPLGNVTNYPYLGNLVSVDGDHEPEVAGKIGLAWNNFKKLDKYLIQPKSLCNV